MQTILVVDDDLLIRNMIKNTLEEFKYNVLTAGDAKAGLKILREKQVDVVLLDIVMKDESGLEMLPKIKGLATPPVVIMMTGTASIESSIEAIRGGAYDYITKPVESKNLDYSIKKAFEHIRISKSNTRLMNKLKDRVKELELFEKTSKAILGTFELEELLENIMNITQELFGAETCSILLIDDITGELVFTIALGDKGEKVKEQRISPGQGIAGWVAEQGEALLVPNASEDKRFSHEIDSKTGFTTKSIIAVPLKIKSKTIGVIEVINKAGGESFSREDINRLTTIANQVAIAINNTSMTEDIKSSHKQIEEHNKNLESMVKDRTTELETANIELTDANAQVQQTEKLSSIGSRAASIADEINNPIGFISRNINTLGGYANDIVSLLKAYETINIEAIKNSFPDEVKKIDEIKERVQLDFIKDDIAKLIEESKGGAERVFQIVRELKNFARDDDDKRTLINLHYCLDSTLNIISNELNLKAEVIKEYGNLPLVECFPMKLKQVFMNLIVNSAQAIEDKGRITIKTFTNEENVFIMISDTGEGIEEEKLKKIFDPFSTTKETGKGTGLDLSVAYNIIKEHDGEISVQSKVGEGTTFTISIPISMSAREAV